MGTISGMELLQQFSVPMSPYGTSTATLNWSIRRIHFEEPWLTSFVFHPGLVLRQVVFTTLGVSNNHSIVYQITRDNHGRMGSRRSNSVAE
jgi:hypothetical protein